MRQPNDLERAKHATDVAPSQRGDAPEVLRHKFCARTYARLIRKRP